MKPHDDLGLRMKHYYENIPQNRLVRRIPVIIRLDGRAFHTFTKGLRKPFDNVLQMAMMDTMRYLCENVQGCVLGYTQSDEITLLLIDYQKLESQAWFDYEVQKLCSVSASMATMAFNKAFREYAEAWRTDHIDCWEMSDEDNTYFNNLYIAMESGATFDSRCFNIPKEEVTNLLYWRQSDAMRNSIQMLGRAHFSHRRLHGKSCQDIRFMLEEEKQIDWYTHLPIHQQRGSCCIKESYIENGAQRSRWIIDNNIPVFKNRGRQYIDKLVFVGEDENEQQ